MAGEAVLGLRHIAKRFGAVEALSYANLRVRAGEWSWRWR